jgi:hypothetical protein
MNILSKVSFVAFALLVVAAYPTTAHAGYGTIVKVPEAGSTASLLGLAILGLVAIGRKLRS